MNWWQKLAAAFGLGDTADESDVVLKGKELKLEAEKIPDLQKQVDDLTKERDQLQAKVEELTPAEPTAEELAKKNKTAIEAELVAAVKDFKITADAKTTYAETYAGKPEELKAALSLIPENTVKPGAPVTKGKGSSIAGVNPEVSKYFGG